MNDKNLNIDKLIIGQTYGDDDVWDGLIKLIHDQQKDYGGLNHLAIQHKMSDSLGQKLLHELKCKSINTFELKDDNMHVVNQLLQWKMTAQKQLSVIIDVYEYHSRYENSDQVVSLFKQVYENVHQLFVQQIALDIKIRFEEVRDSKVFKSYLSLYSLYFENSQFLLKYNKPKCNIHSRNLYVPRDKPYTYFYINESKKEWQQYFVFGATNVQMK